MLNRIIKFFLENKLVTFLVLFVLIAWGIITAPFSWDLGSLPRDRVPVDAIPNLGENQQIVYTQWPGRSPQDIEDQITYPLTTALLGLPGVNSIRSSSMFGLSSIYIIFDDNVEFYWSRTRILEKLNSLPSGTLPQGVQPALGPDATALGQVYWYTLEGRDKEGNPAGGWDPQELRTIQDFYVKYGLSSAKGVSEVASIGGFVKEYQVDMDPAAMKAHNVSVADIMSAVKKSNRDIGARTLEYNRTEYLVRALGYIENLDDLRKSVVKVNNNVPIRLGDVAKVNYGPAPRRGGLDKGGAEAVGGVVVARYGENPMKVIENIKAKIEEIGPGLPTKTLDDGTQSTVTIVPFYDRSGLIKETLGTLESALSEEMIISIIVVIILVLNLRASFLISSLLPIGVLMTFIVMKHFGVTANIVALSGIAIAIGVMVDVGVVITENIVRHIEMRKNRGARGKNLLKVVYDATSEVASAVVAALFTTIISFLPVFTMEAAEGKLFKPLAFTKTFAMIAALIIGLIIIPTLAHLLFSIRFDKKRIKQIFSGLLTAGGVVMMFYFSSFLPVILILLGINNLMEFKWPEGKKHFINYINIGLTLIVVVYFLTKEWLPLGAQNSLTVNLLFVVGLITLILGFLMVVVHYYKAILRWSLNNKVKFLAFPVAMVIIGLFIWLGTGKILGFLPDSVKQTTAYKSIEQTFPGLGEEFMPALDEGSFLLMPTTMPHSGIEENLEVIALLDKKVNAIPEVDQVVGKWGRVNSALDPAPVSMYENVINYKPEYVLDEDGHRMRFKTNSEGAFELKDGSTYHPEKDEFRVIEKSNLIPDKDGDYFRQWRDEIQSADDIWKAIVDAAKIPGLTSAPKLQPIQTRLVMLQTGMRAPMGLKVYGPDLQSIEKTAFAIEDHLKEVEGVKASSVFADRVVGKPYLEIDIDRDAIARYGLKVEDLQKYISTAVGGTELTTTVEGRERFAVRARYAREFRDSPEQLMEVLIPTPMNGQIPLGELAELTYRRGPQVIKSEDTFLVGYVIFDKLDGFAEIDVVENAQALLQQKIDSGELDIPKGVNYKFAGDYKNQVRATKRLMIVVPVSLLVIFLILYFQFRSVTTTSMIFSGILISFAGGFLVLWLYGQQWFLNFDVAGINMRDMFQIGDVNLSVAVWVGFIALFGIATDNGVLIGTYLRQIFAKNKPGTIQEVRDAVVEAGGIRIRPAMMTTATTIIALIPVLSSTGKGSGIMVPMAIPTFGGMILQVLTVFVVPVLYSIWQEKVLSKNKSVKEANDES